MKSQITLNCDIYDACRTNTARARKDDMHYDFPKLVELSGARFNDLLADLQWCAEHKETDMAINSVKNFANALLSAYEIQEGSY